MGPRILEPQRTLSSADLASLEQRLRIKLPDDYRAFLLRHNGGVPERAGFRFKDDPDPDSGSMVNRFLAVYDGRYDNFEQTFQTFKGREPRLPAELVPIARDPGGNVICIATAGPNTGAVYFWDHEREGNRPSYDNIHLIANNFEEFLEGLYDHMKEQ